jgi:hypothetical protein
LVLIEDWLGKLNEVIWGLLRDAMVVY